MGTVKLGVLCCLLVFALSTSIVFPFASASDLELTCKWTCHVSSLQPTRSDEYVYMLTSNGDNLTSKLVAVNASTGDSVWSIDSKEKGAAYNSAPAVMDGYVYTAAEAFDAKTGNLLLDYSSYSGYGSPKVSEGVLLITASDPDNGFAPDNLIALDAKTGNLLWSFDEGGNGHMIGMGNQAPAVINGIAYFACKSGVIAFDITTGSQLWRLSIIASGGFVAADNEYVLVSIRCSDIDLGGYKAYCIDASTGHIKWTCRTPTIVKPTIDEGIVFIGDVALDISTGNVLWNSTNLTNVSVMNGVVYSEAKQTVFASNASTGESIANYTFTGEVEIRSINTAQNVTYVTTVNGYGSYANIMVSALELTLPEKQQSQIPEKTSSSAQATNSNVAFVVAWLAVAICIALAVIAISIRKVKSKQTGQTL